MGLLESTLTYMVLTSLTLGGLKHAGWIRYAREE